MKTTDLPQVTDKLYHIKLVGYTSQCAGFELTNLVVIGTDCTRGCKSNYHTIRTTTAPQRLCTLRKKYYVLHRHYLLIHYEDLFWNTHCELWDGCSHKDSDHFFKLQLEAGRKETSLSLFGSRKLIIL